MKKLAMTAVAAVISATSAFADSAEVVVNDNFSWPSRTESGERYQILDRINVITLPGQNTNGEDLTCVVHGYGYGGGLSCNWVAPAPQ